VSTKVGNSFQLKTNKTHQKQVHWFLRGHKSYRCRLTPIVSTVGLVAQHCLLRTYDKT